LHIKVYISINCVQELNLTIKNNEELHELYPLPDIIRMVKSRSMRWVGHIERIRGEKECVWIIGGKTRRKYTTRKSKKMVGG
jgi:hypothetical protein